MASVSLGEDGFLEYYERYGVLICRQCQYAIHKSAVNSHLLRHKIYRGERQRLLAAIARFDLLDPDKVPIPSASALPIEALPAVSGYRCKVKDCSRLTASIKRMRRHWSDAHGLDEAGVSISELAHPAQLRTFFRGTKLRYFEVCSPDPLGTGVDLGSVGSPEAEENEDHGNNAAQAKSSTPTSIELNTLTYYHHYTTSTASTLPGNQAEYWTSKVVALALEHRFIISGLLSISADHKAALESDPATNKAHCEQSAKFHEDFTAGLLEAAKNRTGCPESTQADLRQACDKIRCILDCVQLTQRHDPGASPIAETSGNPKAIVASIKSLDKALQTWNSQQVLNCNANQGKNRPLNESINVHLREIKVPAALMDRIRTLPHCMALAFGKPDNAQDVLITLQAIGVLVECCGIRDTGTEKDRAGQAWQALASWLTQVRPEILQKCETEPAGLVVLAHWAASLVKRAEVSGCWWMRGLSDAIIDDIGRRLQAADQTVRDLVDGLL